MTGKEIGSGALGIIGGILTESVTVWRGLHLYTNSTESPLLGGGAVGFLAGMLLGFMLPTNIFTVMGGSAIALGSIAWLDLIIKREKLFTGLVPLLYALGFLISGSLSFLATKVSKHFMSEKPSPAKEQAES
jgi:hypothetical protein